ncbi:glycosyltransferase family 1 protein [Aaosphaeria arxii CBS 175.79]|uniref:UDP-N-acetylglucosamine transferase subunit ALG13 n=1 Tax=Aaosphaeria arxii CBS 175.79 TaxID=1450172 RepID=A0A6A5Y835_9PLEO|nr:glycosyltransferase family 1 protein [Aaosphaeria arxii CBS 175.79]KAF2020970.1 glycosyltransferase family 1 protein [Aaosphaeria arxii CBS 175.79]
MSEHWAWSEGSAMKVCFVTTGATAPFTALIESVLQTDSIKTLRKLGYTHLLVQYGSARNVFEESLKAAHSEAGDLVIAGIDFDPQGLDKQLKLVSDSKGTIISHAGSGSILAALRYQVPLIVVPNTQLLDNHQSELAIAMDKSGYLIEGQVNNISAALDRSETFRAKMTTFPPITSGKHRETKSFAAIMDETMGFLD